MNSIGKVLSFTLQLLIVSYVIRTIGGEAYGSVVLALALTANMQLLEAGFGIGVTKYIAEYQAKGDRVKLLEIINTNFIVTTIFAIAFSCILLVINEFFLGKIFSLSPVFLADTKQLIRILIPASIIEFWSVSIVRVAEGFQRYTTVRMVEVMKWLLRLILVVILVSHGWGLTGIGIAYLCAGVVNLIVLYMTIFTGDANLKVNLYLSSKESFRLLFGFSIWIFFSKVFAFFSYRIDVFLLGVFLSPIYITYYDVAFKIYEALKVGLYVLASALVPVSSELDAATDGRRLSMLFKKVSTYSMTLIFPLLVFALFFAGDIISLWVGNGQEAAIPLTRLFLISLFFLAITSGGAEMMVGLNRVKELAVCAGIASLINLAVSIILVKKIGVSGVVIGTLVGTIILSIGRLYLMLPAFNLSSLAFLKDILLRPLISSIVLASILFTVSRNLYLGAAILGFFLISLALITLDESDRRELMRVFF